MHDIFNDGNTKGILLIDAENAFNSINRKVMLHDLKFKCPVTASYMSNCYMYPARLFIISGRELLSKQGTTQGDPTLNERNAKVVASAYDFMAAGKLSSI